MNAPLDEMLADAGRLWAVRVCDPAFADWDGFTAWLEADPAHNAAYEAALDEIEAGDALFDAPAEVLPVAANDVDVVQPMPRWRVQAVAACAAAVAMAGGWFALDRQAPARVEYATAMGERRTVVLDDGSRVILNGGTRLSLDAGNPRDVAMVGGEAVFDVKHDASRPFVITTADGTRLVDVGTRFNVDSRGGALDVAVAEGAVMYQGGRSGGGDIRLDAGEVLVRAGRGARPIKRAVPVDEVGAWQAGQLYYTDATLADVAADLSRNIGVTVAADQAVAARRFSGTITIEGDAAAVMARIAPVLDVGTQKQDRGWRLTSTDDPTP
jgi:transmembrane sensor